MVAATQIRPASSESNQTTVVVRNNAQVDAVRAARSQGTAEGAIGLGLLALIFWPITAVIVIGVGAALTAPMNEPKNNSNSNLKNAKTNTAAPKPRLANQSSNQTRATIEELPDIPPPPRTATPSPDSTSSQTSKRSASLNQASTTQASRQISPQTSNVSASQNRSSARQNISSTAQPKIRSIFVERSKTKQTLDQASARLNSVAAQNNSQTNHRLAEVQNPSANSNAEIKVASPPLPPRTQTAQSNNVQQTAEAKASAQARANVYLEEKDENRAVYDERTDRRGMRSRRSNQEPVIDLANASSSGNSDMQALIKLVEQMNIDRREDQRAYNESQRAYVEDQRASREERRELRAEMKELKMSQHESLKKIESKMVDFQNNVESKLATKSKKSYFSRIRMQNR